MSLPSNKSKSIRIDEHPCRWTISEDKENKSVKIIIQRIDGGKLILKTLQELKGMLWLYNHNGKAYIGPITPNWVLQIGKMAMAIGWIPTDTSTFYAAFKNGILQQIVDD
ncbi:MAG: hypothetical protein AAF990_12185 [Bacteroidota bacterium]